MQNPTIGYPDGQLLTDISFEQYQAIDAINASGLKMVLRSPQHFFYDKHIAVRRETPALKLGKLVHQAVLEPHLMATSLCVQPDYNLRTKQGKEDLSKWQADLPPDAIQVTDAEYDHLTSITRAAMQHPVLKKLLCGGKKEATLVWQDDVHGVRAKARYDFVTQDTAIICDVKTAQDASADAFSRAAYNFSYFLSAAHYLEGARATGVANPDQFVFICLEKTPPFAIALYQLSADAVALGAQNRHRAMEIYADCKKRNEWPGYPKTFQVLEPPGYARF